MFSTLTSAIEPYLIAIRIALFVVVAALLLWLGYDYGSTKVKVQMEAQAVEFTKKELSWKEAVLKLNDKAAEELAAATLKVAAIEKERDAVIADAQKSHANQTKDIQNAANKLIQQASSGDFPVKSDGLWAFVESGTCHDNKGGSSTSSQTAGTVGRDSATQCRLSAKTSVPLIQLVADADQVAATLNLCITEASADLRKSKPVSSFDYNLTLPNRPVTAQLPTGSFQ